MTEMDEKNQRHELMTRYRLSELDAALRLAEQTSIATDLLIAPESEAVRVLQ